VLLVENGNFYVKQIFIDYFSKDSVSLVIDYKFAKLIDDHIMIVWACYNFIILIYSLRRNNIYLIAIDNLPSY